MTNLSPLQQQLGDVDARIVEATSLLTDPDMAELAQQELIFLQDQKKALELSIQSMSGEFIDSNDDSSMSINTNQATMEIRGGAGGEEAKIWADDLIRMYSRYADNTGFKWEMIDAGYYKLTGKNVYSLLKYESGVHRVQRVPETEAQGRVHTSTASVAVLPIIKASQLEIKEEELDWQFVRSGGAGGQNVNKVNTAVRLTHKPSGLTVHCSTERTQHRNREIALELLRAQLWEVEEEKRLGSLEAQRKAAVGRNMRAEKIRTYNYPQNRVTDHRINESWYALDRIMEGDIKDILNVMIIKLGDEE